MFERYHAAVRFLEGLSNVPRVEANKKDAMHSVYRMRHFLGLLGNPEKAMQFMHVTGTAGKGTAAYMLQNMLSLQRGNVGLLNSPFVTTAIEKIRIDDQYIAPDEFADIVEALKPMIDRMDRKCPFGPPNYFEMIIAIALVYFARKKCKLIVWEVGCGGTHDATNVIQNTIAAVITNIDFDHEHILGNTLAAIAREKAGIIKKGSRVFTAEHRPHLRKIFKHITEERGATLSVIDTRDILDQNAALARAVGAHLGVSAEIIEQGIAKTRVQCRFEMMQRDPLTILDGAHSPIKMQSVVENLKQLRYKRLIVVIAIAANKNIKAIVDVIAPCADVVIATRFHMTQRKCANPTVIAAMINKTAETYMDPEMAFARAMEIATHDDCILVTGSFFLAGEIRKQWYSEDWVLKNRKSLLS